MTFTAANYIAASTNRFNHAASCSTSSLIALASGKFVALWDTSKPSDRGVYRTLSSHNSTVTCVEFLDDTTLVSADEAGVVKIWKRYEDDKWDTVCTVKVHEKAVSALALHTSTRSLVTGASDATVKVWAITEQDQLHEVQSISLKGRYPLSIALATLPQSLALVLAIAATDRSVQVFTRSDETFIQAVNLPGHEDWVRALAFLPPHPEDPTSPLVLASGSQDATIRLWNIEPIAKVEPKESADELLDAFEAALGEVGDAEEGGRQITLKRHVVTVKKGESKLRTQQFSITFDALLVGHESGITSLSWRPGASSVPTLLSTSTDSSLVLWSPSSIPTPNSTLETTSIWINRERFGDVGGQRLGGFVGGLWGRGGFEAFAWGWAGGWRRWVCATDAESQGIQNVESEKWVEVGALSGHAGPVRGLSWSPGGEYLISAGLDQTTRIHACISGVWHEISRPQVHGYDLIGVAFLSTLRFVSVADEKVARVFDAPRGFVKTVKGLGAADLVVEEDKLPANASVPPLGLSNKANNDAVAQFLPVKSDQQTLRRPFEGELAAVTLWPEIEKVFGHGYESIAVAASHSGKFMATACKATTPKHAVVRVYDTANFQPAGTPLEGHALTVTRIVFSPDDTLILTVSRDRTWRLFRAQKGSPGYVPIAADKSHARIIWDCSWAPDGAVFATASRDKTVKIWQPQDDTKSEWTAVATLKLPEAATAVAFSPGHQNRRVLAIGLETGELLVYTSPFSSPKNWTQLATVAPGVAHVDHIYQLAWRPAQGDSEEQQLASCSEDGTLRILNFSF
ncbi:WD40 repeat-like protein [Amylostereum chailletii]|nr:WD40 repeat-like protein [Amylostereum chailletii]